MKYTPETLPNGAVLGWHWTGSKLRDGSPIPPIGEVLKFDPERPVVLCYRGYHASRTPWQALYYAPGATLHRVAVWGDVQEDIDDKFAGRNRVILASLDATTLLRRFACDEALRALPADLPSVAGGSLTSPTDTAWGFAWDVAWDAARAAARAAIRDDVWAAERIRQESEFNSRVYSAFGVQS